jgi:hypothetical protein
MLKNMLTSTFRIWRWEIVYVFTFDDQSANFNFDTLLIQLQLIVTTSVPVNKKVYYNKIFLDNDQAKSNNALSLYLRN